jgi:hypothetical protein
MSKTVRSHIRNHVEGGVLQEHSSAGNKQRPGIRLLRILISLLLAALSLALRDLPGPGFVFIAAGLALLGVGIAIGGPSAGSSKGMSVPSPALDHPGSD